MRRFRERRDTGLGGTVCAEHRPVSPLPGALRVGAGAEVEGPHRGRAGVKQDAQEPTGFSFGHPRSAGAQRYFLEHL